MDIARVGHRCCLGRATSLAELVPVRRGRGWFAARSGVASNDLNVMVSEPGFVPDWDLLRDITAWFEGVPASWLIVEPDESVTRVLLMAGLHPERSGWWSGRTLEPSAENRFALASDAGAVAVTIGSGGLEDWLTVASSCGWCEGSADLRARRDLLRAGAADPRRANWVARRGGSPIGMASGWCEGLDLEIVDLAVCEQFRRRGVGTALVQAVLAWGASRGARQVVAQPSPLGWRLLETLGFVNHPVEPDVCFYLA